MKRATETRVEHCFDWITADDLVRMAVQACAAARLDARPPPGERFVVDGAPWSTRGDFADTVCQHFEHLVKAHAWRAGAGEAFEASAVWVARFGAAPEPAASS
jgi:hypothetical protein